MANRGAGVWAAGEPVWFTASGQDPASVVAAEARRWLMEQGWRSARVAVDISEQPGRVLDAEVRLDHAGPQCVLSAATVSGTVRRDPQRLLADLGIRPGMPISLPVVAAWGRQLEGMADIVHAAWAVEHAPSGATASVRFEVTETRRPPVPELVDIARRVTADLIRCAEEPGFAIQVSATSAAGIRISARIGAATVAARVVLPPRGSGERGILVELDRFGMRCADLANGRLWRSAIPPGIPLRLQIAYSVSATSQGAEPGRRMNVQISMHSRRRAAPLFLELKPDPRAVIDLLHDAEARIDRLPDGSRRVTVQAEQRTSFIIAPDGRWRAELTLKSGATAVLSVVDAATVASDLDQIERLRGGVPRGGSGWLALVSNHLAELEIIGGVGVDSASPGHDLAPLRWLLAPMMVQISGDMVDVLSNVQDGDSMRGSDPTDPREIGKDLISGFSWALARAARRRMPAGAWPEGLMRVGMMVMMGQPQRGHLDRALTRAVDAGIGPIGALAIAASASAAGIPALARDMARYGQWRLRTGRLDLDRRILDGFAEGLMAQLRDLVEQPVLFAQLPPEIQAALRAGVQAADQHPDDPVAAMRLTLATIWALGLDTVVARSLAALADDP